MVSSVLLIFGDKISVPQIVTGPNKLNEKYTGDSGAHEFIIFSKEGNELRKHIKKLINENAILGDEVNTMNSRGRHILNELYIMFKKDPHIACQN